MTRGRLAIRLRLLVGPRASRPGLPPKNATRAGTWLLVGICFALGCGDSNSNPPKAIPPATVPSTPIAATPPRETDSWTAAEIALLESLSVRALRAVPTSASNRVADDPAAAELGHRLFFDAGLSRDGSLSCASCHVADLYFTDGRATSRGLADTTRNAPTIVAAAHSVWQFWDGRRDSLWAQALAPIESAAEMGSTRAAVVHHVVGEPRLAERYARIFGGVPKLEDPARFPARAGPFGNRVEQDAWYRMSAADQDTINVAFANIGKAIAAYERRLVPGPARFDRWLEGLRGRDEPDAGALLTEQEIAGLRLFLDPARSACLRCHNGPLFTNQVFHDIGTALGEGPLPDLGRFLGLQAVLIDPFNCLGPYSDAPPGECKELRFLDTRHAEAEIGKFKTPSLRGLPKTAPYMHDGRFATLEEVVDYYREPPVGPDALEITALELDDAEAAALVAFLRTLDGGIDGDETWLRPPLPMAGIGHRPPRTDDP